MTATRVLLAFLVMAAPAAPQTREQTPPSGLSLTADISGTDEAFLTRIHKAIVTPEGKDVLVYDLGELTLLRFAFDGRFVGRVGREGGGPGEFRRIDDFGFLGDSLWVHDRRQRRITWFEAGEFKGTQSIGDSALTESPFTFLDSNRLATFSWGVPDQSLVVAFVKTWDGSVIDSVAAVPRGDRLGVRVRLFGQPNTVYNVFADAPLRVHNNNGSGVLIVHRPRPEREGEVNVRVVRYFEGRTDDRSLQFESQPLTAYETDRFEQLVDAVYEQLGRRVGTNRSEIAETYREALGKPEFALPVYQAELEDNGRVWLATEVEEDGMTWVWLDDEMRIAGSVTVPRRLTVHDINRGLILAAGTDEWDVPRFHVYSVDALTNEGRRQ